MEFAYFGDAITHTGMITEQIILKKIHSLPENLKVEIVDFIEFLTQKYHVEKSRKVVPEYGSLRGTFIMADDFDEPLEEFKDYM